MGLKLSLVFGGVMILSINRYSLWYIIMVGTILFAVLFNISIIQYFKTAKKVLLDINLWRVIGIVFFLCCLGF